MGIRKEFVTLDKAIQGLDVNAIRSMDDTTFMALVVVLVDTHTRVKDIVQINEEFTKEMEKDYVDDFLISLAEFMECRRNYGEKVLKERIEKLNYGRG